MVCLFPLSRPPFLVFRFPPSPPFGVLGCRLPLVVVIPPFIRAGSFLSFLVAPGPIRPFLWLFFFFRMIILLMSAFGFLVLSEPGESATFIPGHFRVHPGLLWLVGGANWLLGHLRRADKSLCRGVGTWKLRRWCLRCCPFSFFALSVSMFRL